MAEVDSIKYINCGGEEHPIDASYLEGKTGDSFVDTISTQEIGEVKHSQILSLFLMVGNQ